MWGYMKHGCLRVLHLKVEVFGFKARKYGSVKWMSTVFATSHQPAINDKEVVCVYM